MKKLSLLLMLVLVTGCDDAGTPESEALVPLLGSGKSDGTWLTLEDGSQVPSIAGTYHLLLDSAARVRNLETGEETQEIAEAHVLVTVSQSGATLSYDLDFCDLILPESGGKKPFFKTETIRSFPSINAMGSVAVEEDFWVARMMPSTWVIGASLADPALDALPQDDDAPEVEDSDQDGKPGVSMGIVGYPFRIYVALKADVSFSAALYSQGTVWQGDAVLDVDTSILGDDIPFVNARNQFEASSHNREVISEFEGVTLLRIEEPGTTCENMVERSAFLTDGLEEQPPVGAPPGEGTAEELVGEDVWEEISATEGGVEEDLPTSEEGPEPETEGASEGEDEEISLDEESAP